MKPIPDAPDGGNIRPLKPIQLPQRDTVTNLQIGTLLNIGGMLTNILLNPLRENDDSKWRGLPQLDGGVLAAAEATFINLCAKLDEIIADETRFNFNSHNTLEAQLSEVYAAHLEFTRAQTSATRSIEAPHRQYNPAIMRLPDGNYIAILGSLKDLDGSITGYGPTPALAIEAFDGIFNGKLPDHLVEWLKKKQIENETQQQQQQVDGSRRTSTPPAKVGGKTQPERDRRKAKTKPGIRADKAPRTRNPKRD